VVVLWHYTPEADKRDLRQARDEILAGTIELLGADRAAIPILDTERGMLQIEAQRGFSQEYLNCFGEMAAEGGSPCCRAARSAERIVIEDVEADTLFIPFRPMARAAGYRALHACECDRAIGGVGLAACRHGFRQSGPCAHPFALRS
jgi:GAF domain-containing protein